MVWPSMSVKMRAETLGISEAARRAQPAVRRSVLVSKRMMRSFLASVSLG